LKGAAISARRFTGSKWWGSVVKVKLVVEREGAIVSVATIVIGRIHVGEKQHQGGKPFTTARSKRTTQFEPSEGQSDGGQAIANEEE
jgi:hypothetical protein